MFSDVLVTIQGKSTELQVVNNVDGLLLSAAHNHIHKAIWTTANHDLDSKTLV
jgi:hypothetical protein